MKDRKLRKPKRGSVSFSYRYRDNGRARLHRARTDLSFEVFDANTSQFTERFLYTARFLIFCVEEHDSRDGTTFSNERVMIPFRNSKDLDRLIGSLQKLKKKVFKEGKNGK